MTHGMSFPMLDIATLTTAFNGINFNITEQDFKNPKRENWERFYSEMVVSATGCSHESLYQAHLSAMDLLTYPELHERSIPLFHISKAMGRVLYTCGVNDFKISDITEPKPRRLIRFCSAIINFFRFQDDRVQTYNQIKEENAAVVEQRKTLLKENEDLNRQINSIKSARAEKAPQIQAINDAILGMSVKMQENQDVATQKQKDCTMAKQRIAEKRANLAKVKEDIARTKEEGNRLSGQIVQSPERMKGEMDRMQQKLDTLKCDKERVNRLMEYKKKREMLESKMSDSEQALKLVQGINEQIQQEKQIQSLITRTRDSIQTKKEQLRQLELKEHTLRRMLQAKQDKLSKTKLQQQSKLTSMKENLQHYQREKDDMEESASEEQQELNRIQEEIRKLVRDQELLRQQTQQMVDLAMQKYSSILEHVDSYHKRLGDAWQALKPEMELRIREAANKP